MKSKTISITNTGKGMDEALAAADRTSELLGLSRKDSFHLRLLAEEMMGMVRAITGAFTAEFWIENEGPDCRLCLLAKSELDYQKRKDILSVSTSGKNTARLGIMEKIRGLIEAGLYGIDESFRLQAEYGTGMFTYGGLGIADAGMSEAIYSWSMQKYRSDIENSKTENPDAWDELEKSIIANIADEVNVGVRRDSVELIVRKKFGGR